MSVSCGSRKDNLDVSVFLAYAGKDTALPGEMIFGPEYPISIPRTMCPSFLRFFIGILYVFARNWSVTAFTVFISLLMFSSFGFSYLLRIRFSPQALFCLYIVCLFFSKNNFVDVIDIFRCFILFCRCRIHARKDKSIMFLRERRRKA